MLGANEDLPSVASGVVRRVDRCRVLTGPEASGGRERARRARGVRE